jgi:hypothetical protein
MIRKNHLANRPDYQRVETTADDRQDDGSDNRGLEIHEKSFHCLVRVLSEVNKGDEHVDQLNPDKRQDDAAKSVDQ